MIRTTIVEYTCPSCSKEGVHVTSTGRLRPHAVPIERRTGNGYERCTQEYPFTCSKCDQDLGAILSKYPHLQTVECPNCHHKQEAT